MGKEPQKKHRTGRDLVLATLPFAKEDKKKSWYYTISTILFIVIAFSGTFAPTYIIVRLFFSLIFSLLMIRFFILYHDYNHHAILKNSKAGDVVMLLFGIFILAPISIWKRTHDYHHKNNSKLSNNGIGSYPLVDKQEYEAFSKKEKVVYLLSRHPLVILFGYVFLFILDFNVKSLILSPKKHWDSLLALVFHFGMWYALYAFGGLQVLFISWILPFFISNCIGSYLFYAQHNFPNAQYVENENWNYTDAAIKSTSFLKMNKVMNWFTGDIGYHHIHHLNHHIPFYRLREAMENIPEMQNPIVTTFKPSDIWACLRLKVWDHEKGAMTPLR